MYKYEIHYLINMFFPPDNKVYSISNISHLLITYNHITQPNHSLDF